MTAHPNRSRAAAAANPAPADVRAAREAAGLTQTQAAHLIHSTLRAWQEWEAANRRMHAGLWELFLLKTHRLRQKRLRQKPRS
jgi:putative transcriptional regulator